MWDIETSNATISNEVYDNKLTICSELYLRCNLKKTEWLRKNDDEKIIFKQEIIITVTVQYIVDYN